MTQKPDPWILDNMSTAVLWADDQLRIRYVNQAFEELLQVSAQRLKDTALAYWLPQVEAFLPKQDLERLSAHEVEVYTANELRLVLNVHYLPVLEVGQKGWVIELVQLDRHKRIIDEDERWREFERSNQLVRSLAHEIKNPLTGIDGAAQLIQRSNPADEDLLSYVSMIRREVRRLKDLVDNLLGPRGPLNLKLKDIHDPISHVLSLIHSEKTTAIQIKTQYDLSIPEFWFDEDLMIQALLNMLRNALEAMRGQGLLQVRTSTQSNFTLGPIRHPLVVVIEIQDNGPGIPPEMMDSIFLPMITTKPHGSGLGLPMTQSIFHRHDGLVVAKSQPGKTLFTGYLPLILEKK